MADNTVVEVRNLVKHFSSQTGIVRRGKENIRAVDGVSFSIKKGETFGLVGESGCGKTTVGRCILRLTQPTQGEVKINGLDILSLSKKQLRILRPKIQMIFQDPFSSLDPRMPVGEIIGEAVKEHKLVPKSQYREYILKVMEDCGLRPYYIDRYPHEFSGGQRQRICIARALALNPDVIICDEPVSALDVSIQAQIINLMRDLQKKRRLSYLFISHDLSVVEHISHQVGVMYLGTLVEKASREEIFANPIHPYTKALFSAVPIADPDMKMSRIILKGDIPSPANPPAGCKFHTRCPVCRSICREKTPKLTETAPGHYAACHFPDNEITVYETAEP